MTRPSMNNKCIFLAVATVCSVVAGSANAQIAKKDFDIAGIKFGMSPSDVAGVMRKFGEGHTLGQSSKYSNNGPDAIALQQFCLPQAKNEMGACNGEIRVGYSSNDKTVFFIQRTVDTKGSAMQDDVIKGLTAKYGISLVQDHLYKTFSSAAYVLDAAGKKVLQSGCEVSVGRELPQRTRADCDFAVYVQVLASNQPTLNDKYIVAGTDHAALRASIIAAQAESKNAKEMERKKLEGNAKQQKF